MRTLIILFCTITLSALLNAAPHILFKDSDHQLEIIRIKGQIPGPTVLVFGGIHGDEPGGYFSSEILSGIKMIKGNIIIVPRVNFPGIMKNKREIYGDMNRKFHNKKIINDPDSEVMEILKQIMSEADVFINQHDAFGFHRSRNISRLYNTYSYGQCLIIDTDTFFSKKFKKKIHIQKAAEKIINSVNSKISEKKHHFTWWNHKSLKKNTKHKNMQKSATYYALTNYSIPAFGLETSKNLPSLKHKVKYQLMVIKEILNHFGLKFKFPKIELKKPELFWVEFTKNSSKTLRANSNTNIRLKKNDKIKISKIHANMKGGISCDYLNWGSLNDMHREITFNGKQVTLIIRKNHVVIGKFFLKKYSAGSVKEILVQVNGRNIKVANLGIIKINPEDTFRILPQPDLRFDIRGFETRDKDDASHLIIPHKHLITKYSSSYEGNKLYRVKIYKKRRFAGSFQIEVTAN